MRTTILVLTRPSGKGQAVALGGLGFVVALEGRERILVLEEQLEARDVALLVGGHLGGEGAHRVGARVGRHVVVEGLRAPLEAERDAERVVDAARRRAVAHGLAAEIPAELPAGELGKRSPGGAQRDDFVLLAFLAPELLELRGERACAVATEEALQLGVAPRRFALEQKGIREQLRQVSWQQTRAHGATPCTTNVRRTGYVRCGGATAVMSQIS